MDLKELDKKIQKEIDKGNKRMALISCILCAIFAIPVLFTPEHHIQIAVVLWLILTIIGVRLSPWIINKIWKDE